MSSRNLDDTQSEILSQFQAITHTDDVDAAVSRLTHYDWNLERAVESVYDPSNSHDATREALEEQVASSAQQHIPSTQRPTARRRPQPRTGIFALFAWPLGIAWNMTWSILSFLLRLLSRPSTITHTQSNNRQDSRSLAQQFKRDFELKFGETHVDFFQGGYSQALERARRDLRFLFVILQSDEHDDTEDFCRNTLTSQDLIDYMGQHDILVWAGNVRNLGATKDLNDAIDFTNNDLRVLGNFPRLVRLQHLYLSNNRIHHIDPHMHEFVPNLTTLILNNNAIGELGDLEALANFKRLTYLSLLDNPVTKKQYYRLYLIHKLPKLRVIDFVKIKQAEREEAAKLFQTEDGKDNTLAQSIADTKTKTFEVGSALNQNGHGASGTRLTQEEQLKIKEALKQATSLDEISRLERLLKSGQIPK